MRELVANVDGVWETILQEAYIVRPFQIWEEILGKS